MIEHVASALDVAAGVPAAMLSASALPAAGLSSLAEWQAALQDNAFLESMRALFGPGRDFRFLRPGWLLGLLLLPLLLLWWRRRRGEDSVWREAIDPHLLKHLLQSEETAEGGRRQRLLRKSGRAAAFAGVALAFVAMAGPSWRTQSQPLWEDRTPLVIALDLSERILATDLPPSRLQRARAKIGEVLRRRSGGQMALVVYAGDAFTVTPLTEDAANIALYLDALHPNIMPGRGSRTDRGIDESALLLRRAGFRRGDILVITDMPDGEERRIESAAREAAGQGYRVSVLGLASERGAARVKRDGSRDVIRLDSAGLRDIAAAGKGRYAPIAADDSDLRAIGVLEAESIDATPAGGKRGTVAIDEGYWLLPLLMLAALFAFRRGVLVVALLCCLPWQPAQAAEGSLWLRDDQRQHRQMQAASEAYRKRDYANAERMWSALPGAEAAYNRGNALARQGRLPEAVEAYDRALRERPGMTDAIENRRAVLEAMRKRKPPQNPDQNPQQNQQNNPKQDDKQQGQNNDSRDRDQNGGQQRNDQRQDGGDPQQQDRNAQQDQRNDPQRQQQGQQGRQNGTSPQRENGDRQQQEGRDRNDRGQGDQPQDDRRNPKQSPQSGTEAEQNRQNGAGTGARRETPVPLDPNAQRQANAAQRAQMDRALAQRKPGTAAAGTGAKPLTEAQRQQMVLNDARLRRVPDDPGGLLRAKFLTEDNRRADRDERK